MKKLYLISILILVSVLSRAQVTFQKVYMLGFHQSAKEVLPTSDGGYLIAGMTRTSIAGDTDIFMIKTNGTGDIMWTKQYGGIMPEYPNSMLALDDGGFFILGYTRSYGAGNNDSWLIKIDAAGNMQWNKTYGGGGDDEAKEIIKTSDGNYVFVGRTNYSGGSNYDGFLTKIDGSGNALWTKYYGSSLYETTRSVKQCSDGGFIALGQTMSYGDALHGDIYLVRTNSSGDMTWYKTYGGPLEDDGNFVLANNDGTFTFTSETTSFGSGDFDVQATKVSSDGTIIWNKFYGGTEKDVSKTIRYTNDGGYIIGAISRSFGWTYPQMWLVKIDGDGNMQWSVDYGIAWYHDHCHSAMQVSDGGYLSIGHQADANNTTHIFFVKTNSAGLIGVDELAAAKSFSIFPNPSNGIFNIVSSGTIQSVKITDVLGNSIKYLDTDERALRVDIADKPKGAYLVTVQSGKSSFTRKIVLK
jgi:hypothetical protein